MLVYETNFNSILIGLLKQTINNNLICFSKPNFICCIISLAKTLKCYQINYFQQVLAYYLIWFAKTIHLLLKKLMSIGFNKQILLHFNWFIQLIQYFNRRCDCYCDLHNAVICVDDCKSNSTFIFVFQNTMYAVRMKSVLCFEFFCHKWYDDSKNKHK